MKNPAEGIVDKAIKEIFAGHRFTYLHLMIFTLNCLAALSVILSITFLLLLLTNQRVERSETLYYSAGILVAAVLSFITLKALAQACQILLELSKDEH